MYIKIIMASTSFISILGSCAIIYMILRGSKKLRLLHNRILVCMSIVDVLYSSALSFSTSPIPRGSRCTFGNIGNAQTCAAQGFFVTLGGSVPLYNAALSIHYMARICYKANEETIAKKFEVFMHATALIIPFGAGILGLVFNLFQSRLVFCWIADECRFSEEGCGEGWDGVRAKVNAFLIYLFVGIYTIIIFVITTSMFMIFRVVRKREQAMKRYSFKRKDNSSYSRNILDLRKSSPAQLSSDQTAKQAILYVLALLITYCPAIVSCIIDLVCLNRTCKIPLDELNIFIAIFHPLQGFFNFIIFVRPRYILVKSQNKGSHFFFVLKVVIFEFDLNQRMIKCAQRPVIVQKKQVHETGIVRIRHANHNKLNDINSGDDIRSALHDVSERFDDRA